MVVITHSNTSMKCKNRTRRETSASVPVIDFAKLLPTLRLGEERSAGLSTAGAARCGRVHRAASAQPQCDQLFREETLKRNLCGLWVSVE